MCDGNIFHWATLMAAVLAFNCHPAATLHANLHDPRTPRVYVCGAQCSTVSRMNCNCFIVLLISSAIVPTFLCPRRWRFGVQAGFAHCFLLILLHDDYASKPHLSTLHVLNCIFHLVEWKFLNHTLHTLFLSEVDCFFAIQCVS